MADLTLAFGPCAHLKQVLGTATVRTLFLKQYALGVRVARFTQAPSLEPDLQAVRAATLQCHACRLATGLLYLCLQCAFVGCAAHFPAHTEAAGHVFAVDTATALLQCCKCREFVGTPALLQPHTASAADSAAAADSADADAALVAAHSRAPCYKAATGLRGLVNMGATCFISSVLQTLIHNPYLRAHFFADGHAHCALEDCITCCVDEIFTEFYTTASVNGYGPTRLLTVAWKTKRALAGYTEQDAHEFWQFLMDEFHLARDRSQPARAGACPCVTHTTFRGELQSTTTCGACGACTVTVDPMLDWSLEIAPVAGGGAPLLAACFARFTAAESLDVLYACGACGARQRSITKQLRAQTLPRVLGVQLKRFEHRGTSTKIETHVAFPLYLDMAPYTLAQQRAGYELFALVVHMGSASTGHYVSVVKREGQWFKMDDSVVSLVSEAEVLSMRVYLLYYAAHER